MNQAKKLSAGCIVCRRMEGSWRVLILRAYRNWDFPKGLVEPGEDPLTAAAREVKEETGLAALEFPWGLDFIETEPYAGGKIARYYLALSRAGTVVLAPTSGLGRPEHHEFRWARPDEAHALLPPRLGPALRRAETALAAQADTRNLDR